ncbi:MAG TPA: hypothetical protein VLJ14_02725, partial [Ktedonobacterales bacterium]|nr:hypothetical protein [Ktedonobacterales bacterium]
DKGDKGDKGEMGDQAARDLLAALLVRGRAGRTPSDEVVRVYHLMKTSYVRDPRTGARSSRPREVLDGALDTFLLAYLTQAGTPERALAAATVTLPRAEG